MSKDKHEKKISKTIILGGVGLLTAIGGSTQDIWFSILVELVNKVFGTDIIYKPELVSITDKVIYIFVGLFLLLVRIWFHFNAKGQDKRQTMLQIRHSSIESGDYSKFDTDLIYPTIRSSHSRSLKWKK